MPFVIAAPEMMVSAASDLAGIGSIIDAANAAALPITVVMAAAGDEVSVAIAALFSSHARAYQSLSAQASSFHQQFLQAVHSAGISYAAAETANAALMQTVRTTR